MKTTPTAFAANCIVGGFLAILQLLCVLMPQRIPNASQVGFQLGIAGALFMLGTIVAAKLRRRSAYQTASTIVHAASVLGLFAYLFGAMEPFQHILVTGWMDEPLLRFEKAVVGIDVSVALQQFLSRPLTEWMMFSYMIYVPLLPGMAWLCFRGGGSRATEEYLLFIAAGFCACYVGFILFPVASPMFFAPQLYPAPLTGWFFTWTSDLLRHNAHYAGGSLPSPHCAAGTIMLIMFYRYQRRMYYVALPVIISLYVATVYGRFHYVEDGIAGILVAILVVRCAPVIVAMTQRLHFRMSDFGLRIVEVMSVPKHVDGNGGSEMPHSDFRMTGGISSPVPRLTHRPPGSR